MREDVRDDCFEPAISSLCRGSALHERSMIASVFFVWVRLLSWIQTKLVHWPDHKKGQRKMFILELVICQLISDLRNIENARRTVIDCYWFQRWRDWYFWKSSNERSAKKSSESGRNNYLCPQLRTIPIKTNRHQWGWGKSKKGETGMPASTYFWGFHVDNTFRSKLNSRPWHVSNSHAFVASIIYVNNRDSWNKIDRYYHNYTTTWIELLSDWESNWKV